MLEWTISPSIWQIPASTHSQQYLINCIHLHSPRDLMTYLNWNRLWLASTDVASALNMPVVRTLLAMSVTKQFEYVIHRNFLACTLWFAKIFLSLTHSDRPLYLPASTNRSLACLTTNATINGHYSPPGQYPSARVVCVLIKLHSPPTQVGAWQDLNVHPPPLQAGASHSTNMHLPPPQSAGSVQPRNRHFPDKQSLPCALFLVGHGTTLRSFSSKTGCSTGRTRASVSMAKQNNIIAQRNDDIALIGKLSVRRKKQDCLKWDWYAHIQLADTLSHHCTSHHTTLRKPQTNQHRQYQTTHRMPTTARDTYTRAKRINMPMMNTVSDHGKNIAEEKPSGSITPE